MSIELHPRLSFTSNGIEHFKHYTKVTLSLTFVGDVAGVDVDILVPPPTSSSSIEKRSLLAGIMPAADAEAPDVASPP